MANLSQTRSGSSVGGLFGAIDPITGAQTNAFGGGPYTVSDPRHANYSNFLAGENLQLNQQQAASNQAATRANVELQLAQMQRPSSYAELMSTADFERDGLDARYGQALADLQRGSEKQVADYLAMMEGAGDAARERIYRDATADRNSVGTQLAGTGLYNTSVLGTIQQSVNRNRNEALGALDDSLRQQKAGQLADMTSQALARQQALVGSQLGMLGSMANQKLTMDMQMRGNERELTPELTSGLLDMIANPKPAVVRARHQ